MTPEAFEKAEIERAYLLSVKRRKGKPTAREAIADAIARFPWAAVRHLCSTSPDDDFADSICVFVRGMRGIRLFIEMLNALDSSDTKGGIFITAHLAFSNMVATATDFHTYPGWVGFELELGSLTIPWTQRELRHVAKTLAAWQPEEVVA
jgi:hypothetical protein